MAEQEDDGIVGALMLLFDGLPKRRVYELVGRAMPDKTKWVCECCGSADIVSTGDVEWDEKVQRWVWADCDRDWCRACDADNRAEEVPIDWVKPDDWGEEFRDDTPENDDAAS